ncbi:MAG TPA: tetratricopeptide repeat protein [Chitinophagales bacterium]|nr:tetratricopeptide repeat protein [Chitinophagales bacterium]HRG28307.1 tetratricopeptide repeat protein [Chitinophagales bacterium]HRG86367.1 tetratricopeptide repeat protein [Chitinophagales bacterium]HRH54156.1 tetratricopeptide repeat protein [Chitinophagales bacterium]
MKKNETMRIVVLTFLLLISYTGFAQNSNAIIKEGNDLYEQKDYKGAQQKYEQAVTETPDSDAGNYNLGNTYYQQQEYDKAAAQYERAAQAASDPETRANAYHNLGNAYLQQKKYEESINAYKQSLRDKPTDDNTKYNLAYAQKMLKQQQQQQQQNQDKNQQKKEEPKKQDQQKQDQNQQKQEQQQKEQQQPAQPKEYSKEELERILQSLNNDDKNVQEKVNKQKSQSGNADAEKDW